MASLLLKDYEKTKKITEYIAFFFLALAVLFQFAQPEAILIGFWVSIALAVISVAVAIYNDIKHEKHDKIIERVAGIFAVALLTAAYFLFIA